MRKVRLLTVSLLAAVTCVISASSAQAASSVDTFSNIQPVMLDSGDSSNNNWICYVYFGGVYCYQV
jgi:hypothetical protein